jgi:hypothetical protein
LLIGIISIFKATVLHNFQEWLQSEYKHVKIVNIYIGSQLDGEYHFLYEDNAIVVVIDDIDVFWHKTFRYSGKRYRIICKLWRYPSPEGLVDSNPDIEHEIPEKIRLNLEQCLKENSHALLEKHSNLEIISISAFRSKRNGEEREFDPCIALYCSCKGVVPYSEELFPKEINGIKTDIREGFFYWFPNDHFFKRSTDLLNPLMAGANIGRAGKKRYRTFLAEVCNDIM